MPTKAPVITCGSYLYNLKNNSLLVCHATHSPWSQWSIPKGIKDAKEDSFSAAVRELKEETSLDAGQLQLLKIFRLPAVKYKKQNKILESFLIVIDIDPAEFSFKCSTLVNNEFPEVDAWKWIHLNELKKYLHESQQEKIEELKKLLHLN